MRAAILTCMFLGSAWFAVGQQTSTDHPTVSSALERTTGGKWTDRRKAFEDALELMRSGKLTPQEDERLRLGMIQLLLKESTGGLKEPDDETQTVSAEGDDENQGEDQADYYSALIIFVAGMNDERAIPALLAASGSGGIATRAVAGFGKKALDATLVQIGSQDPDAATGALYVVRDMLEFHTVTDPDSLTRIKSTLRSALASPEYRVRENAMSPIEYLPDREEFVPILQEIATHDPYKSPYAKANPVSEEDSGYIVRRSAQLLLRQIANHEPPVIDKGVSR